MPNKTANYQLNQWEPSDPFLRTDFNEDNAKIDAAIAAKPDIVVGAYTGDGSDERFISLGFTPKAVLLVQENGKMGNSRPECCGGLALPDHPVQYYSVNVVEITNGGFLVRRGAKGEYYTEADANGSNLVYHYLAIK